MHILAACIVDTHQKHSSLIYNGNILWIDHVLLIILALPPDDSE